MPGDTFEYVMKADRDSGTPTVFVFRPLSAAQQARIAQQAMNNREVMVALRKAKEAAGDRELRPEDIAAYMEKLDLDLESTVADYKRTLADTLVDVRNLSDLAGAPVEMTTSEFLEVADYTVILELGPAAINGGRLSEADAKNSDAQHEPTSAGSAARTAHG